MCDPRDAYDFRRIVDDVHHSPIPDANPPLILVAFEFFASRRPRSVPERLEFADNSREHVVR